MKLNTLSQHLAQSFRQPEKRALPVLPKPKAKIIESNVMIAPPKTELGKMEKMMLEMYFKKNRLAVTAKTEPPHTEQEIAEYRATSAQILHNLYHSKDLLATETHAEMRMNLLKITLALFRDTENFQAAETAFDAARQELRHYQPNPDPEINRKNLDMLAFWLNLTAFYAEFLPKKAFIEASFYNTGIQILHYLGRVMSHDVNEVAAAFRVIRGASLESTAVKHQISQSKLRNAALEIGQMLYRIGIVTEEYGNVAPADSIPKLRSPEYVALANLDNLKQLFRKAKDEYLIPFERAFGISQVNWDEYQHNIAHGQIQIANKLKCE